MRACANKNSSGGIEIQNLLSRKDLLLIRDLIEEVLDPSEDYDYESRTLLKAKDKIDKFLIDYNEYQNQVKRGIYACKYCFTEQGHIVTAGTWLFLTSTFDLTYFRCTHCNRYYYLVNAKVNDSLYAKMKKTEGVKPNFPEQIDLHSFGGPKGD